MMSGLKTWDLGEEGLRYLRNQLSHGMGLSQRLLRCVIERRGHTVTFVPDSVSEARARDLFTGGLLQARKASVHRDGMRIDDLPNLDGALVSVMSAMFQSHADAVVIFEHPLSRLSDPWLENVRSQLIFSDERVYFVASPTVPLSTLETAMSESRTTPEWVGAMVSLTSDIREMLRRPSARVEVDSIADAVDDVWLIAAGAYDGEGFILWEPGEL